MKKFTPLLLTCLVAAAILASCNKQDTHAGKTLTIYDTALMMFHEFVAESNDTNLGFSNADEVLKARIAIDSGISMYILGKGLKLKEQGDSQELDLHITMQKLSRMLYPVYVGNVLHAAITFDSTKEGWRPVMFENANVLIPYLLNMQLPSELGQAWKNYYFVSSPDLHTTITIRHDSGGDYVLPTNDLKRTMAENYPNPNDAELKPIKKEDFFYHVRQHLLKMKQQRKHRKRTG